MNRTTFLVLLSLPFMTLFFIKPDMWFFILAWVYFTVLKFIRFYSIGLTINQILLTYTPFGLKYWQRLFEKDSAVINHPSI